MHLHLYCCFVLETKQKSSSTFLRTLDALRQVSWLIYRLLRYPTRTGRVVRWQWTTTAWMGQIWTLLTQENGLWMAMKTMGSPRDQTRVEVSMIYWHIFYKMKELELYRCLPSANMAAQRAAGTSPLATKKFLEFDTSCIFSVQNHHRNAPGRVMNCMRLWFLLLINRQKVNGTSSMQLQVSMVGSQLREFMYEHVSKMKL